LFDRLPDVWSGLLSSQSAISSVVEDLDLAAGNRLRGYGVSVFLTDEFVQHAKTPPLFWIGPELLRTLPQNDSPILDLTAIRRTNSSDGLNLFVWELDLRATFGDEFLAVGTQLIRSFFQDHSGFKIKEVIGQHPFGRVFRAAVQVGGWLVQNRRCEYAPLQNPDAIERARAPFVLGLTRELAHEHPGWLSALFDYRSPRLFLTPGEQRMLNAALDGRTDDQLAEVLAVSISAVKKCWQSVYARISLRLPELLPDDTHSPTLGGVRGVEKKRCLVEYLRNHPEELRPHLPPSSREQLGRVRRPRKTPWPAVARS
jgi:hypothetical protein